MQFLQDFDMNGSGFQFMFQTPNDKPPSTASEATDGSWNRIYPLLDGHENLHLETLGLSGDMDPYLLQRYQTDENGTFKFKQLAIRSVNDNPPVQFLISQQSLFTHSRREAGHLPSPTVDLRRELEKIITQGMGKRLIDLYMRFIAPHYPIFSADSLPDPATSAPGLLAAIYSISSPFAMYDDQLCIDMAYDSPDPKDLAGLINTAVASDIHSPTLATVQALFLVVAKSSSNPLVSDASYRWTTMGMLASAAVNIGLHLDPSSWNIPLDQSRARRRLSFFIFALDKWLAAALGRPPHIHRSNWLVDELTIQDDHSCGLDTMKWTDAMEFSALTSCLASTLDHFYSIRACTFAQTPGSIDNIVSELLEELDAKTSRDTEPKDSESIDSVSGVVLKLGQYYIRLLILRARIHSTAPETGTPVQEKQSRASLREVLEEFHDFVKTLRSDETAQYWQPWCQSAFSSLCFAMLFMFVSSPDFDEAFSFIKLLEMTRRHMRLKANAFVVLRLGLLRTDAIFWRGLDQILKLEPHVKLALEASKGGN
ncbi:Ff.00g100480.m01.CDS01 [Fusarium sp. VM40]|nr:Ff.00g100480.m01.CDS01 [Fusarium sp. VM40]